MCCFLCFDCFDFEEDPYSYYMRVVKNRSIDNAKQLHPPLTYDEKKNLMKILYDVPPKAREIITSNCIDSGAGTGIHLNTIG